MARFNNNFPMQLLFGNVLNVYMYTYVIYIYIYIYWYNIKKIVFLILYIVYIVYILASYIIKYKIYIYSRIFQYIYIYTLWKNINRWSEFVYFLIYWYLKLITDFYIWDIFSNGLSEFFKCVK